MAKVRASLSSGGSGGGGLAIPVIAENGHWQTYSLNNALDGNENTYWISSGSVSYGGTVTMDFGELVSLSKIVLRAGYYGSNNDPKTINIYGADENNQNKTLITSTSIKYTDGRVDIPVNGNYRYYYIEVLGNSAAFGSLSYISAYY